MTSKQVTGLKATSGVGMMFFSNGAIFAALLPWYPLIAQRLELTSIEFGFIVASFAVGALVSSALPAPLIARFGATSIAVAGTLLLSASIAGASFAGAGWVLALCLFLAGFFDAIVDVAQNVAGIRVQSVIGRSIMSSMHAFWSLGALSGGVISTAVAASGVLDIKVYLMLVGIFISAVVFGGAIMSQPTVSRHVANTAGKPASSDRRRVWRLALAAALPLIVIAISGTIVEDIANNWAGMAGLEIGGLPASLAGIVFSVMVGSQCVGRFAGDLLIHRFGAVAIARVGGALIAIGGLLVITSGSNILTLFAGVALAGYGSATLVPSALTAAAKIPGVNEGAGVTLVSWLMRVGFLLTSPVVGTVADNVGLRWGLSITLIVGMAVFFLSPALREPRRNPVLAEDAS
ncbi:MFS transporter [Glutamicibacter sp. JL.03c]|uniref:MFS transporter n=1 Tax=Glutamicibacter sp. JL.03c TaxID=2984842 RepID=UPI0021F7B909|nr:MFS transporter [Glutamicibacter sp. JL.03c]UYQ77475.1 MFS transporter [Glutamicibacter sp. JL.03c]